MHGLTTFHSVYASFDDSPAVYFFQSQKHFDDFPNSHHDTLFAMGFVAFSSLACLHSITYPNVFSDTHPMYKYNQLYVIVLSEHSLTAHVYCFGIRAASNRTIDRFTPQYHANDFDVGLEPF